MIEPEIFILPDAVAEQIIAGITHADQPFWPLSELTYSELMLMEGNA